MNKAEIEKTWIAVGALDHDGKPSSRYFALLAWRYVFSISDSFACLLTEEGDFKR
jgi:hypothetical protein